MEIGYINLNPSWSYSQAVPSWIQVGKKIQIWPDSVQSQLVVALKNLLKDWNHLGAHFKSVSSSLQANFLLVIVNQCYYYSRILVKSFHPLLVVTMDIQYQRLLSIKFALYNIIIFLSNYDKKIKEDRNTNWAWLASFCHKSYERD